MGQKLKRDRLSYSIWPICLENPIFPIIRGLKAEVRPLLVMNRFATILLLIFNVFLAGCAKPDVKYSDLRPAITASVSGGTVTIHLGSDITASACWTRPKAKVDGQTVYVVGYRTMREQNREFIVQLPVSVNAQSVTVVWLDPDGSHFMVPISK